MSQIVLSVLAIAIAFWLGSWLIVYINIALVKISDFFNSVKEKWQ